MRIAIIGSGISGNAAAWALTHHADGGEAHDIVMYERRGRVGGHSCTIPIDYDGTPINVDVGFIVYNTQNYPNLVELFDRLGVNTTESDMSFGVSMKNALLEWSGKSLKTIFVQKKNIISPSFWTMLRDVVRFNRLARKDLGSGRLDGLSMKEYLAKHRFSRPFIDHYLAPMGAAIWSTPHASVLDFPASNFISFFDNHRLMHRKAERPRWRTVVGGSVSYVNKLVAPFETKIRLNTEVVDVERKMGHVHIVDEHGVEEIFDHVIFAGHTDQMLKILSDATPRERAILGAIEYRDNDIYLHRDTQLMPKNKSVWSAWNYIETPDNEQQKTGVCVSYYLNLLQNIDETRPVFVSLNPLNPPDEHLVFAKHRFAHPQFNQAALLAQKSLNEIQGFQNSWYCGAWCGYGFHEDGLKAGLEVAERLGAHIPWRCDDKLVATPAEAAE